MNVYIDDQPRDAPVHCLRDGDDVVIWARDEHQDWRAYRFPIEVALNFSRRVGILCEGENGRLQRRGA